MQASHLLIGELDEAIRQGSNSKRVETLRRITDLFLADANRLGDEQVALFDHVLGRMIGHIENKALAELGQRLASVGNAPTEVIRQLASNDEITVAGPVLARSSRLTPSDLVNIAKSKGQEHLLAISHRDELGEEVTDVLVDRGDSQVACTVARNRGARFSSNGFSQLVERAQQEQGLAEVVAIRAEMSPVHFRQLAAKATDAVRCRLLSIAAPNVRARVEAVVGEIAAEIERSDAATARDYAIAQDAVSFLQHDKGLLRTKLAEFAVEQKFEETVAALSMLGGIKIKAVEQFMLNSDEGGILILCRATRLEWPTVHAVLALGPGVRRTSSAQELAMRYAKLNVATAERVLRFWQVRTTLSAPQGNEQLPDMSVPPDDARRWQEWTV